MANLFHTLELEAFRAGVTPRTKQSREWFMKKAQQLSTVNRAKLMREEPIETEGSFILGSMFMYAYDPKHKKTLPYYDRFPLSIIVDVAPGGFYGLNMHYLPPVLRAQFLDSLMDITNNKKFDETTKFNVTADLLKSTRKMRFFKPCWKHYLNAHVKSNFARVMPPEWEIAVFLPMAQFKKQSEQKVWAESRKKI